MPSLPDEVKPLLDRFITDVGGAAPLVALWAHGSLALGDFQPGRSDLDLVALIETAMTPAQKQDLRMMHEALHREYPLAEKLHCAYVAGAELDDTGHAHPTWAHGELFDRIVSPVSRRELWQGGLSLLGPRWPPWFLLSPTKSSRTTFAVICGTSGIQRPPGLTCGCKTSGSTWGC